MRFSLTSLAALGAIFAAADAAAATAAAAASTLHHATPGNGTWQQHLAAGAAEEDTLPRSPLPPFAPPAAAAAAAPRHRRGALPPAGVLLTRCAAPHHVALTFDDGPTAWTDPLLAVLAGYTGPTTTTTGGGAGAGGGAGGGGAKATFFLTGANHGHTIEEASWRATVARIDAAGHQVASHTWSHAVLEGLPRAELEREMRRNDEALAAALPPLSPPPAAAAAAAAAAAVVKKRRSPAYMRPPEGACGDECRRALGEMGYRVVGWDVDSGDWRAADEAGIAPATAAVQQALLSEGGGGGGGHIVLLHETHPWTHLKLVPAVLETIRQRGLVPVTVGECLGDDGAGWYRAL